VRANSLPVTVLEQWVLALMFLQNGGQNSKMKRSIKKRRAYMRWEQWSEKGAGGMVEVRRTRGMTNKNRKKSRKGSALTRAASLWSPLVD